MVPHPVAPPWWGGGRGRASRHSVGCMDDDVGCMDDDVG